MSRSGDNLTLANPTHELFTFLFVRAAREYRGAEGPNEYTRLLDIIRRVDEGATLAELRDEREREHDERAARYKAEQLAKPEPKDKTSDDWRYWKFRQVEHAFGDERMEKEGREAYNAAHVYCRELLLGRDAGEGDAEPEKESTTNWRASFKLSRVLADPRTPPETRTALEDALDELSMSSRVHVHHPALARRAFLLMCEARPKGND